MKEDGKVSTGSITARKSINFREAATEVTELEAFAEEIIRLSSVLYQAVRFDDDPRMKAEQRSYA